MKKYLLIVFMFIHAAAYSQYTISRSGRIITISGRIITFSTPTASTPTYTLQELIDTYEYVVFGSGLSDVYNINKPLVIPSNRTIEINGEIKMDAAEVRPLLDDIAIGDTFLTVSNPANYYEAGQWIMMYDTLQPIQGGGAGHTRRIGWVAEILSISNDTIYFTDSSGINVSVSDEGIASTFNSCFIVYNVENVHFKGTGIINQNKAEQFDAMAYSATQNEPLAGSAVSIENASNISFDGITIKNSVLHNLAFWTVDYIKISNINSIYAHDKNYQFYDCRYAQIVNSRADSSDYEDGFMLYYGNSYFEFSNCQAFGNGRRGFGVNSNNQYIDINNCNGEGSANNLYIGLSQDVNINNFISIGGGIKRHSREIPTSPLYILGSNDISISNMLIDGCNDSVNDMFLIAGDSYNINISDSRIKNSANIVTGSGRGFSCDDAGSVYPHDVHLTNVLFDTLKVAFAFDLSGPEEIIFDKCVFARNAATGTYRTFTQFYKCNGYATNDSGYITFTSAQTLKYGSIDIAAYPNQEKFDFWYLDDAGSTTKVWCDWTSGTAYPGNNFRVNLDVAPGKDIDIAWTYDHNLNTVP